MEPNSEPNENEKLPDFFSGKDEIIRENQTNEPFMSRKIGIFTLSLKPHKIGINAINVINALII